MFSLSLLVTLHPRTTVALEYTTVILSCMAKDSVINPELQVNGTYTSEHNIDYLNSRGISWNTTDNGFYIYINASLTISGTSVRCKLDTCLSNTAYLYVTNGK